MTTVMTWFGHSAVGLRIDRYNVLIDPFFEGNPVSTVKPDQVEADYILVTHGHGDHLGDTIAIARRTGATVIANSEISAWLEKKGVKTHAQHLGGGFVYPFGYVKLTLAVHGSSLPDGSYGGNPGGFLITTPSGKKIYHAGDTGLFGDMHLIGEEHVNLAMLPIGDNYTMGPEDALRAVRLLRPEHVIPFHFNTWNLLNQDAAEWVKQINTKTSSKAHLLKPGETFTIPD
jgi:L-ascorbate metabolism protein UlaG (beta-lactamase superfamily)